MIALSNNLKFNQTNINFKSKPKTQQIFFTKSFGTNFDGQLKIID